MEATALALTIPADVWQIIFSYGSYSSGFLLQFSNKELHACFSERTAFWHLLWDRSGFTLPAEFSDLSIKSKFKKVRSMLSASSETASVAVVDRTSRGSFETDFPHGSRFAATIHLEHIPYGYYSVNSVCGYLLDMAHWPAAPTKYPVPLGDRGVGETEALMTLIGRNTLASLESATTRSLISVPQVLGHPTNSNGEEIEEPEEVQLLNRASNISVPSARTFFPRKIDLKQDGQTHRSYLTSANENSNYPWLLVMSPTNSLRVLNIEKLSWTASLPTLSPGSASEISVVFSGKIIAFVLQRTQKLCIILLDENGGFVSATPRYTANLSALNCNLTNKTFQFTVSTNQQEIAFVWLPAGVSRQPPRVATISLGDAPGGDLTPALQNSIKNAVVLPDLSQTFPLEISAFPGILAVGVRSVVFFINAITRKILFQAALDANARDIKLVDSALYLISSSSSLVGVDLLGRETSFAPASTSVSFYAVWVKNRKSAEVVEYSCPGAQLRTALTNLFDVDASRIDPTHHADPSTKDTTKTIEVFMVQSFRHSRFSEIVQKIAAQFATPAVRLRGGKDQEETPSVMDTSGKGIPHYVMIRATSAVADPVLSWSLPQATKAALAFCEAGIFTANTQGH